MLEFFDYFFYRVSTTYKKWGESSEIVYGVGLLSIMQMSHIMLILIVLALLFPEINYWVFQKREGLNFMHSGIILPSVILLSLNFLRYNSKKYMALEEKWKDEDKETLEKRNRIIIIYIISTLVITIAVSIYRKYFR